MVQEYDPEPERYYDWMLWKLRQERKMEQDDPMDDITKDGSLSGWIEKPFMSEADMYRREIAEMQKTNHTCCWKCHKLAQKPQGYCKFHDGTLKCSITLLMRERIDSVLYVC